MGSKCRYTCSIYEDRPEVCKKYPWNFANSMFAECIFVDETVKPMCLRTIEEQLTINTEKEISDYCIECGRCCFFGPAPCSKLNITKVGDTDENE
jgi:Fe-S-cluster containining protein